MKKAIVAVVLLILVGVLAIPLASGLLMERAVRRAFKEMNVMYAGTGTGFSFEIVDYDRHYLTSDIEWKIDLGYLKSFNKIDEIVFNDHAEHGFAGVVATTSLKNNPWYAQFVADKLNGQDPLHITTRYGIWGSIESTVVLDDFSVMVEGETIDVKGADLITATDRKLENFTSSGTWAGLSVGDTMAIEKASMTSSLRMFSPYVWDGDMHFEVQGVAVGDKINHFELDKMEAQYLLKVNDDRTQTALENRFSIEGLNSKNMKVDTASVRLAVNGIDVKAYESFMQLYTQTMSQFLGDVAAFDGNSEAVVKQQLSMFGFQMMAALEKMLKKGLAFEISDLHVKLADGEINGGLNLRLLKDMTFMQFVPIVSQPDLLFDVIYLKSDVSLPVNWVGENPKLLVPLFPGMQTGLFVENGDNLVHQAETVGGKLIVNGKQVDLSVQSEIQPTTTYDKSAPGRL